MPFLAKLHGKTVDVFDFNNSDRDLPFKCPICLTPMLLVLGNIVIHHFRHKKDLSCLNYESREHLLMKKQIAEVLSDFPNSKYGYEVLIRETNIINQIDVLLTQKGKKYAIECQASPLTNDEASRRTLKLNSFGYPVLWILSSKKFKPILSITEFILKKDMTPKRLLKQPESFIHAINFGRVYYLDTENKEIRPIHYERVKYDVYWVEPPISKGFYTTDPEKYYNCEVEFAYTKYLKIKRKLIIGDIIKNFELFEVKSTHLATNETYKIARFYDKKFW